MKVSRFTHNMFGVNTYIIWDSDSKETVIIDPGMLDDSERKEIDLFIETNGLKLTHLVNTHMHIDHAFGISYISHKYDLKLECNLNDQFLAERLKQQACMFGLHLSVENLNIDINLTQDDLLHVGNETIRIFQVPGHSPGSIVIYAPESSFIICGDVLFRQSIGRTDLPGGNYSQLLNEINTKLMTLPNDTVVYPGHGIETTIGYEKLHNPYL